MDCTKPQNLGDIFDNTFALVGKTFKRIVTIAVLFFVPGTLLLTAGLSWFYSTIGAMSDSGGVNDPEKAAEVIAPLMLLFPGILLYLFSYAVVKVASLRIVCGEITNDHIGWKDALRQTFEKRVWRVIGQGVLEMAMYVGVLLLMGIMIGVTASASLGMGGFLIFVLFLTMFAVILYCVIRWLLTGPSLVWEDKKIFESFSRSGELIYRNWWRVFGIMFLFSLLIGFSQMLITTPLMFLTNWNFYGVYFQSGGMQNGEMDPAVANEMMRTMGWTIGVYVLISSLFTTVFEPVYRALLYFDLRARRGEFTEQESARPFASYFGTQPLS